MRTSYFSFGYSHMHTIDGFTYDRNIIVKITAENPRDVMFKTFGPKWCWEYINEPDMIYFQRGIKELPGYGSEVNTDSKPEPKEQYYE